MICPISCFNCGKPISHLWDSYVEKIKSNREQGLDKPEKIALDELNITRTCCRTVLLCHKELALIITN
jgi:DNA-directed RNA polymerase subunit N